MASICVLMSTYNGRDYIREQIQTILDQRGVDLYLLVRDDGSTDGTQQILQHYSENRKLEWYQGLNVGPANSFFDLMKKAPKVDYYAFSDQDDVWSPDKLQRAIHMLAQKSELQNPAMYFSRVQPVDSELHTIKAEKLMPVITFSSECIMNYAFGCTMVFNSDLEEVVRNRVPRSAVMHDWWVYLVCLALSGDVVYDEDSYIKYRQHGDNASGIEEPFKKRIRRRLVQVMLRNERPRSSMLKDLELAVGDIISDDKISEVLHDLVRYQSDFKAKLRILRNRKLSCGRLGPDRNFKISVLTNRY